MKHKVWPLDEHIANNSPLYQLPHEPCTPWQCQEQSPGGCWSQSLLVEVEEWEGQCWQHDLGETEVVVVAVAAVVELAFEQTVVETLLGVVGPAVDLEPFSLVAVDWEEELQEPFLLVVAVVEVVELLGQISVRVVVAEQTVAVAVVVVVVV